MEKVIQCVNKWLWKSIHIKVKLMLYFSLLKRQINVDEKTLDELFNNMNNCYKKGTFVTSLAVHLSYDMD